MSSVYASAMKSVPNVAAARNLLIVTGAYYLSGWLGTALAFGLGNLTAGLTYKGDFNQGVVAPLVIHLPWAITAAAAGASIVWLVESDRLLRWAFFLALLYGLFNFLGWHWARPPVILDRVAQTIGAVYVGLACVAGALFAAQYRKVSHATATNPG
jgi:hypothetical protein